MMTTKPSGLYVHIPFCIRKCNYCDFCSFSDIDGDTRRAYIECLKNEILSYKRIERIALDTVFFGGGTPSLLTPDELGSITSAIYEAFSVIPGAEFTVEVNPKTLTPEKAKAFVSCGVNRVSIGLQTIHENERLKLGRVHNFDDFKLCLELVRGVGINNVSFDIMYGIPGQTLESFNETLNTAISLKPTHISCYGLIIEEGTPFFNEGSKLSLPSEDEECDMYEAAAALLSENGYEHYEISNYAIGGLMSKHNLKYWKLDEYIGVGLAAHSFFEGKRFYNTHSLFEYIGGKKRVESFDVTDSDLAYDFVMLGLRLRSGISLSEYSDRFGSDFLEGRRDTVKKFVDAGYMTLVGDRLALTEIGFYVSNTILTELL